MATDVNAVIREAREDQNGQAKQIVATKRPTSKPLKRTYAPRRSSEQIKADNERKAGSRVVDANPSVVKDVETVETTIEYDGKGMVSKTIVTTKVLTYGK